jgi:DNA gyrase subunit A
MTEPRPQGKIISRYLEEEMKDSYLSYAMSVIVGRALPDARDGLKPVHRRILYAMNDLHLRYNHPHKKCARVVGECFVKDTLVSTTKGLMPIQDIQKGDEVITQRGIRRVSELFYMPPKKLVKVGLDNGLENIATLSQKFKVFTPDLKFVFKEAKDLKKGEYIVLKASYPQSGDYINAGEITLNENIGYLLGMLMSDGWVENSRRGYHRVGFCSESTRVLERINKSLREEFGIEENILKKEKIFYLRINKSEINKKLIVGFGLKGIRAANKFIPPEIFKSPVSVIYSFLSGLIDGDGSIHKRRQILNYASISEKLITQLQVLFFSLGSLSSKYKSSIKPHRFNDKWVTSKYPSFSLEVAGRSCKKLLERLSLFSSKKEVAKSKGFSRMVPSKYEIIPFLGRNLFQEFSQKHIGAGWYYDETKKEKFRLGIKYQSGVKIRYSKDLPQTIEVYKTNIEDLNIVEKARKIGSEYYSLIREILEENIYFIPVKEIKAYGMEETFDIEVEDDHEFIANGMISHNCLGKYHPHGDTAVYDALVRMGQNFSLRYPLIHPQGNFGSIDGDPPAAQRYTECRLAQISDYLLQDIEKNTVNFFPNFDNSLTEPEVLPTVLPNLLINGASGIAVGMATNIPPHNIGEVCDGITHLLNKPEATIKDLHKIIKGPDFPTGGIICGKGGIFSAYKEGRGKLTVRAKAVIEREKNKAQIIISEIPYQLNKSNLLESIVRLINDKRIEGISDLRDESDKEGIRVVVELKRDAHPEIILNNLYKHTNLETTFGVIALALVNRRPQILNLKEILRQHISFRKEVIVRRTKFELDKAERRAHILEGLKIALKFLDEVIKLIRQSKTTQEAKNGLMKKFSLSALQAQSILEMQLQRLCALERQKIEEEYLELLKKIEYFKHILSSEKKQEELIKEELIEVKKKFADPRRTEIVAQKEEIEIEDLIVEEDMAITITRSGYIKRQPITSYRQQRRGGRGVTAMTTGEEDFIQHLFVASSKDTLMIFSDAGKVYPLKTYEVPLGSRTSKGRAIVNLLNLSNKENITTVLAVSEFNADKFIFMATRKGMIKRTSLDLFSNMRRTGIAAITIGKEDQLMGVGICGEEDDAILATQKGYSIRFKVSAVRPTGRQSQGVRGIKLTKGDEVLEMALIGGGIKKDGLYLLTATENGFAKRTNVDEHRVQSRGGKGVINIKLSPKIGKVRGFTLVLDADEVMCITQKGILIRTQISAIRISGRSTQGVKIINLDKGDKLSTIARIIPES